MSSFAIPPYIQKFATSLERIRLKKSKKFHMSLHRSSDQTFNWKHNLDTPDPKECTRKALRMTAPASFWAMITTMLGFFSLLNVSAKPIRDLGVSGMIGTVVAFIMAYSIFPIFLKLQKPDLSQSDIKLKRLGE